ncbi:MAG: DUF1836 domain-containing protein [Eubacteriales bacterium]|nr:DUF1836 domain-containing protein [Eubacteriales bacterium]
MQERQAAFAARLENFSPVPWEMIPDFGLYMDQVVTFVERQCRGLFMENDRVFTPAMVNNYVKFGLVDRPDGKKYGRGQLAQLMMICVLKQASSTDGLKLLMRPPEGVTLQAHYEAFCETEKAVFGAMSRAMPFPSPMSCAVQGAAYQLLCNVLLAKPSATEPSRSAKSAQVAPGEPAATKSEPKP